MKPRPRSAEREVAKHLSAFFTARGWSPVERIPVLGREGPDIDINESKLVIDVKSRKEIPVAHPLPAGKIADLGGGLIGTRLNDLSRLYGGYPPALAVPYSKIVMDYWTHMDQWKRANYPHGITCVILHRPGARIGLATVVISQTERSLLLCQDVQ